MSDLALASEFPSSCRDEWRASVEAVLRGASFDAVMRTHAPDGFVIEPVYERAKGRAPLIGRAPGARWAIVQRIEHPDPATANALALADLEGGADGLSLVVAGSTSAHGHGVAAETVDALDRALDGIVLDILTLRLDAGRRARAVAALFVALAERRGLPLSKLRLSVGYDPVGVLAARGRLSAPWPVFERRIADTVLGLCELGHAGSVLAMDGRVFHAAGASRSQELGAMLAAGLAYLRALEKAGLPLAAARAAIDAVLVADTDAFMTIAALRALRLLWARVGELVGVAPAPLAVHAETAWRTLATRDPWSNMLRGAVAAFAAGVGGADSVTVLPFTAAIGLPDAFARRVARNAQHVLMAEANLHRLADPAAGSGALEGLTDALCEGAWAVFTAIEARGGIVAALQTGFIASEIDRAKAARPPAVVVGVTRYADDAAAPVAVLEASPPALSSRTRPPVDETGGFAALVSAASGGATLGDLSPASAPDGLEARPLTPVRDGEGA